MITSPEVSFRPVAPADFPTLTKWLAEPHVRRFYQLTPVTLADVEAEYGPMIEEDVTICHLAMEGPIPFAYLQAYRNADNPDWCETIGAAEGISADLFIGDPSYLHRGYGRAALSAYLNQVVQPHYPEETRAYIAHTPDNSPALACSMAVGFLPLRTFFEHGVETILLAKGMGGEAHSAAAS